MRIRVVVYNVRGFRDDFEQLVRLVDHEVIVPPGPTPARPPTTCR